MSETDSNPTARGLIFFAISWQTLVVVLESLSISIMVVKMSDAISVAFTQLYNENTFVNQVDFVLGYIPLIPFRGWSFVCTLILHTSWLPSSLL